MTHPEASWQPGTAGGPRLPAARVPAAHPDPANGPVTGPRPAARATAPGYRPGQEPTRPPRPNHCPGETKTVAKDKHAQLAAGVRTPVNYTVQQCVEDWLASLTTQAQTTVVGYQIAADHMIELLGGIKLANLKAHDVQGALDDTLTARHR